jgi:unsaturated rhamnogalacturonyl hydrolase
MIGPELRTAGLGVILTVAALGACGGGGSRGDTGRGGGGGQVPGASAGGGTPTGAAGTSAPGGAGGSASGGRIAGAGGNASAGSGGGPASGGRAGTGANGGTSGGGGTGTLPAGSLAVRFANAVMTRWPDPMSIVVSLPQWEYNRGIVLRGMEQVYRRTSDRRYLAYIQRYADEFVSAAGVVNIPVAHSFDNIQPSVLLPFLFQQTGLAKYRAAAEQIRARYDTIPRNADGGFWHKQTYPNQMWLDSIYMGEPFLMRYGATFGTCGTFCNDTVVEQVLLVAAHVRDPATGLLYHAWDDSPAGSKAVWANATTGRSSVIWGRAMGWYAMALADILPDLPVAHAGRTEMISMLAGIARGLQATQDPVTGLWFQVLDQGTLGDDWIETSGSGMFIYALKVAVNRGYIDPSYLAVANRAWQGLKTRVTMDANGLPTITGAVQGMSVGIDYAGYINQLPTLSNSSHGLCAILLAAAEMEAQ